MKKKQMPPPRTGRIGIATRAKLLALKFVPKNSRLYRWAYLLYLRAQARRRLKKRTLLGFETHLTEHCNLNCVGCNHFSPLAAPSFLAVESFERDCARLAELTGGRLEYLRLLGGEPLLHPRLLEFLRIARKYFADTPLLVLTNGLLLLKQDETFWRECAARRVEMCITKYPINLDWDAIQKRCADEGVPCVFEGDTGLSEKMMFKRPLDLSGSQNARVSFRECYMSNACVQLREGRLYTCPIAAYIQHFNARFDERLEVSERDSIDIYRAKSLDEIFDFLRKPIPFCRYCDNRRTVHGIPWSVSKKNLSEWV